MVSVEMALISTLPLFGTTLTIIVKASLYPQSSQDEEVSGKTSATCSIGCICGSVYHRKLGI